MSQNRQTENLAELDRELAQMALEAQTPPEDFHRRWTEKIRAEAEAKQQSGRKEHRRQWRYILSAAAVFVFLITGTLLTREQKNRNGTPDVLLRKESTEVTEADTAEYAEQEASKDADGSDVMSASYEVYDAEEERAAGPGTANEALSCAAELYDAGEDDADLYAPASDAGDMYAYAMEEESEKSLAGGSPISLGPAQAKNAPETEETAAEEPPAALPEDNAAKTEAETGAEEDSPFETEEQEDPNARLGLTGETVEFLKDMGVFILRALPYILGATALAFLVALMDRIIREKRGKKS